LVVGDVVLVKTGDQVPADLRIFYASECKVETSSLTGESLPITLTTTSEEPKINEAHNIAWNTSQCLEGESLGIVFATGDRTFIGRIARLASDTHVEDSPLQKEIKYFVRRLTLFSFVLGWIFFGIGMGRGIPWITSFINGFIIVMVANVPEGLPMTVVSCLTITAKRMASRNVFIKQLRSVETLGSATVIASDKTGTLTQNKMTVSRLWVDLNPLTVDAALRDLPVSILKNNPRTSTLYKLEHAAVLCNRARFDDERDLTEEEAEFIEMSMAISQIDPTMTLHRAKAAFPTFLGRIDSSMKIDDARDKFRVTKSDMDRGVLGEPSDIALFNFVKMRQSVELMRYHNRKVFEIPFNSRNKFSLTITKPYRLKHEHRTLWMKGAPEVILERCSTYLDHGSKVLEILPEFRRAFQQTYENFGSFGERVLGLAMVDLDLRSYPPEMDQKYKLEDKNFPDNNLIFLGLVSLVDPPKDSVPPAIEMCRAAGIRVIMVTGDHPITAEAIAYKVGIFTLESRKILAERLKCAPEQVPEEMVQQVVVKGSDIPTFTDDDWNRVLSKQEIVFARTTPQQKLEIVEHLQALGEIVASTGDGVNDSPALKKADIGVAMGISGSDVARDAGDVVLMDDDFASLVLGIQEGRTIYDNLAKTIAYTVTHMLPEVVPVLVNLAFGLPLAMSSLIILTIDLGSELGPAISLAYEKAEDDVMGRPPRNSKVDRMVSGKIVAYFLGTGVIECLIGFLAFFLVLDYYGIPASAIPFTDKYWTSTSDPLCMGSTCYTADQQTTILAYAQGAYWMMLVSSQFGHIWHCKTRAQSLFSHGMFENVMMLYGVSLEVAIIVIIMFIPACETFFSVNIFPGKFWPLILFGPGLIGIISETRKWIFRRYHKEKPWTRILTW